MKRLDLPNKTITLLTALSVVYAALQMNIVFLSPIITIAIPYKFMKYKEESKYNENKKILTNLFLFNIVSFIAVSIISENMNLIIFDMMVNIVVAYIYYKLVCLLESKQEKIYINPEAIYEKLNKKIYMLEKLSDKMEIEMENAKTEKDKTSIKLKIDAINQKINQNKSQLEIIKIKIESKNK
ncbi:hypothetical protein [Romboutsia sp.]|uniref:hypothetical protein n=1 Tax=Romboutsia sp. TaxID=1965302 RepID=UPI002CD9B6E7|nr:hypothetical protein [Romboutsia sp.]HSQ89513.1 hypothetical protein [Romboutsia sp.]